MIQRGFISLFILFLLFSFSFSKTIQITPKNSYFEDFESASVEKTGWNQQADSHFHYGNPSTPTSLLKFAYSGEGCFSSGSSPGSGTEKAWNVGYLTSPVFDVSGLDRKNLFFAFRMWSSIEPDNSRPGGAVVLRWAELEEEKIDESKLVWNNFKEANNWTNWYNPNKLADGIFEGTTYGWDYSTDNNWILASSPSFEVKTNFIVFRFFMNIGGYNAFAIDDVIVGQYDAGNPVCVGQFEYQLQPALNQLQLFWDFPPNWRGNPRDYQAQLFDYKEWEDDNPLTKLTNLGLTTSISYPIEQSVTSFRFSINSESGDCQDFKVMESANSVLYSENFEHGKGGWKSFNFDQKRKSSSWRLMDVPHAIEGHSGWKTHSMEGSYFIREFSYVVSPDFNFTLLDSDPIISVRLTTQLVGPDRFLLQMAQVINGGVEKSDWQIVGDVHGGSHEHGIAINWYNLNVINADASSEEAAKQMNVGWGGGNNKWFTAKHTLNDSKGKIVRLRFVLIAEHPNDIVGEEGVSFDDIIIAPPTDADKLATNYAANGEVKTIKIQEISSTTVREASQQSNTSLQSSTTVTEKDSSVAQNTSSFTSTPSQTQTQASTEPVTKTKKWNPTKIILSITGLILLIAATIFLVKWMRGNNQPYQHVNTDVELVEPRLVVPMESKQA